MVSVSMEHAIATPDFLVRIVPPVIVLHSAIFVAFVVRALVTAAQDGVDKTVLCVFAPMIVLGTEYAKTSRVIATLGLLVMTVRHTHVLTTARTTVPASMALAIAQATGGVLIAPPSHAKVIVPTLDSVTKASVTAIPDMMVMTAQSKSVQMIAPAMESALRTTPLVAAIPDGLVMTVL